MAEKVRKGYKAFDYGMKCRGTQYAENTVFEEQGADDCCEAGVMHYCENPLDVLNYYPLIDDEGRIVEIAEVEPMAEVLRTNDKCATKKLKIGAKLKIGNLLEISGKYLLETIKGEAKDAAVGGDCAKQVGGDSVQQIGGDFAKQVGGYSAKQVGGYSVQQVGRDCAKQVGGDYAQQVGGDFAKQVGGYFAKQVGGDFAKQVGGYSAKQVSGACAKQVGSACAQQESGKNSVIMAGPESRFKAGLHSVILHYWYDSTSGNICGYKATQVDGETIKADTWYKLENGEFVEVPR